jgi:hypothetical protein
MRKYLIIFLLIFFAAKGNCQISEKYEMTIGLDYLAVYLTDTGFVRIKSHVLNHGGYSVSNSATNFGVLVPRISVQTVPLLRNS